MGYEFFHPLEALASALSNVADFRTFVGADTIEAALEKIFYLVTDISEDNDSFAVLTYADGNFSQNRDSNSAGDNAFNFSRTINLILDKQLDNTQANQKKFIKAADAIRSGLALLCYPGNTGEYPMINQIDFNANSYDETQQRFQFVWNITLM